MASAPRFDPGPTPGGGFGSGLLADIRRRAPHCRDDFTAGASTRVLASITFLFFACLANAVAFGGLSGLVIGGAIGMGAIWWQRPLAVSCSRSPPGRR